MMSTSMVGTFWGRQRDEVDTTEVEVRELMGLQRRGFKHHVAEAHQIEVDEVMSETMTETERANARQAFQSVRGASVKSVFSRPSPCRENAPDDINVYSDGACTNPTRTQFSLIGAGVWWERRSLIEHPLSQAEQELGYVEHRDDGIMLISTLAGFGSSSTRAEIAAGIIAMAADGPIHIGTDSRAFLLKAQTIQKLVAASRPPRRPLSTTANCDLWEHFYQNLKAKGAHALRISKVKRKATQP